jgi:hypothetical protein
VRSFDVALAIILVDSRAWSHNTTYSVATLRRELIAWAIFKGVLAHKRLKAKCFKFLQYGTKNQLLHPLSYLEGCLRDARSLC